MYSHTYIRIQYIHAYIHTYIHAYIYTYIQSYIEIFWHTYTYRYTYIHSILACIHTDVYVLYVCICMSVYVCIIYGGIVRGEMSYPKREGELSGGNCPTPILHSFF